MAFWILLAREQASKVHQRAELPSRSLPRRCSGSKALRPGREAREGATDCRLAVKESGPSFGPRHFRLAQDSYFSLPPAGAAGSFAPVMIRSHPHGAAWAACLSSKGSCTLSSYLDSTGRAVAGAPASALESL